MSVLVGAIVVGGSMGCGEPPRARPAPAAAACAGLVVSTLDEAVAPPANVSALVSVLDCDAQPLGFRFQPDNFELSEDGQVLSVYEANRIIVPANRQTTQRTLIALDLSGSIVRANLKDTMIDGAAIVARAVVASDHQVAVFGFDGRPDLVPFSGFTSDIGAIESALQVARAAPLVDDSTNLYGAVKNGLRVLDEAIGAEANDFFNVAHGSLVLFTDGSDRAGRVSASDVKSVLDATHHSTFTIGLGPEIDDQELAAIGRTQHFLIDSKAEIEASFDAIAHQVKSQAESKYIVSYCSPARAGQRKLRIVVRSEERVGQTTVTFNADGFGAGCKPEDSPLR
ncbi:MAG: hypothetical protein IPK13_01890 [Deltaproteobacteria bacterium]|nr:hypothetical protein [Deltaproteobacteria bacterium]